MEKICKESDSFTPTIYNFTLPRIILKQRALKINIVPDTICPKFNDLLSMFWQIFVCSAKSAKNNNKKTADNYLISWKKSATILVCLLCIINGMSKMALSMCSRDAGGGGAGGACAPPSFGISVNPIRTKGGSLCPPYYYWPPIFLDDAASLV